MSEERIWRGLSTAQADGMACVVCGADYLTVRVPGVPVGRSETGSQVFACTGRCRDSVHGPTGGLPAWWAERLRLLLDALGEVAVSPAERASLAIVAGQEPATVVHLAAVLRRAREHQPAGPVPGCTNASVGILVARDGRLLLIQRRYPPYGWAPPAGHVEDGERCSDAARRELAEEVGLRAAHLAPVWAAREANRCRRPGGEFHDWMVYEASAPGEPVASPAEARGLRWADHEDVHALAERTRRYQAGHITETAWQQAPGLEPVWLDLFGALGWWSR